MQLQATFVFYTFYTINLYVGKPVLRLALLGSRHSKALPTGFNTRSYVVQ